MDVNLDVVLASLAEEFDEESHHGFSSLTSVSLDTLEPSCQKIIKYLEYEVNMIDFDFFA